MTLLERDPRREEGAGEALLARPLFISGCSRGGTTLVATLLAAHPETANVGRGPFNEGQYLWRTQFPDWTRHRWAVEPWKRMLRRTARHATPERVRALRAAFLEAHPGTGRLLEKTPANAVRIPFIRAVFPDATFIHVVRDGRHTAASLRARGVWLPFAGRQWAGAHRTALDDLARLPSECWTLVRYEEVAADPEAAIQALCRRCDLPPGGAATERIRAASEMVRAPEDRWSRLPRWERRALLRQLGPLQPELGYEGV